MAAQVVVDFTATWCGPCRMIAPYYEELSSEFTGVLFLKVDVDAVEVSTAWPLCLLSLCRLKSPGAHSTHMLQDVAAECGVSAMPTFQVWRGGEKVEELVGASKDRLKALVEKYNAAV